MVGKYALKKMRAKLQEIGSRFFIPEDDARKTFLSKPNRFIMQVIHNIIFYAKKI